MQYLLLILIFNNANDPSPRSMAIQLENERTCYAAMHYIESDAEKYEKELIREGKQIRKYCFAKN